MVENDVLKDLKKYKDILEAKVDLNVSANAEIALSKVTKAIKEIQQYEAIGTVEDLQEMKNKYQEAVIDWRQYRKVGTIDEFKALKEKNEAKKPLFSTIHGDSAYHCSICKKFVGFFDTRIYEYCHNCGQKIDWQ